MYTAQAILTGTAASNFSAVKMAALLATPLPLDAHRRNDRRGTCTITITVESVEPLKAARAARQIVKTWHDARLVSGPYADARATREGSR